MTSAAEHAFFNANPNLRFPFGTSETGETLHIISVYALPEGRVLEVRWNPATTRDDSITEFEASSEAAWVYLNQIEREGRLMA